MERMIHHQAHCSDHMSHVVKKKVGDVVLIRRPRGSTWSSPLVLTDPPDVNVSVKVASRVWSRSQTFSTSDGGSTTEMLWNFRTKSNRGFFPCVPENRCFCDHFLCQQRCGVGADRGVQPVIGGNCHFVSVLKC